MRINRKKAVVLVNDACCLAGEGDAPPEDVGGEGGYENFVEIMADCKHPEHAEMKEWVSEQWWHRPFGLEDINWQLKYRC